MAKFSMTCTCGQTIIVEADSLEVAKDKVKDRMGERELARHMAEKHKGERAWTRHEMERMIEDRTVQG